MGPRNLTCLALIAIAACGPPQVANHPSASTSPTSASAQPSAVPSAVSSASPAPRCAKPASSYGLLVSANTSQLNMVSPAGCLAASAPMYGFSSSAQCAGATPLQVLGVSATADRVYFRASATKIRYLLPSGQMGDATTVPGGPNTISFFSVSPDDQRIAVLVEEFSGSTTIKLQLYVEDLIGAGHHSVIYKTTASMVNGSTLIPVGWHGSSLVLEVVLACIFQPPPAPRAYHVADSSTARRLATIDGTGCTLSWSPSPSGVVCVDRGKPIAYVYDWKGIIRGSVPTQIGDFQSGLSPSGHSLFFTTYDRTSTKPAPTRLVGVGTNVNVTVIGHPACLWIDDNTLLAADAVIAYPSGTVTELTIGDAYCAGRFPGGL
jgi:hypothetical protein